MLVSYFFKRILSYFILFFALLTGIFASCNVFLRLPFIYSMSTIPILICVMFPLVAQFALPLSSSLAVYLTIAGHKAHDQLLSLSYLNKGKRALYFSVLLFSLLGAIFYCALVFQLTPSSYKMGKKLLFKVAKEHILQLEPNKFHTPFPQVTLFFKEKIDHNSFGKILLTRNSKDKQHYIFTAQKGVFSDNKMMLEHGSLSTIKKGAIHVATFDNTVIDIGSLVDYKKEEVKFSHSKFMTGRQLLSGKKKNNDFFIEFAKRVAQVIWQLLFPLLALMFALLFRYESFLSGLVFCGVMYLLSYVLLMLGQVYAQSLFFSLSIHLPLALITCLLCWFFLKR